jgi:HD-GYP domain-containing protein (c-di-GMP phosphodiesterase class II)
MSAFSCDAPGRELAERLRLACEAHDPAIEGHLDRVTRYACEIAARLGLPVDFLEDMRQAVPLHDLGKIGLPLSLLHKPGRLTPEEVEVAQTHTVIGHRLLAGSPWRPIQCAAKIALGHHENWAGGGYPQGCAGEAIPVEARIAAVADVYDALSSPRAYKPAWEADRVVAEMGRLRGIKFDPVILDAFLAALPAVVEIA